MKRLPLKTVMNSLRIVTLECGYELHNAAGTAKYDAWGVREEVHGIPEYFPVTISLKGPDFAAPSVTGNAQSIIENAEALASTRSVVNEVRICLSEDIQEALNEAMTNWIRKALKPGGLLYRP